jgi:hypothetical protein
MRIKDQKRGQNAGSAAIFVIIITVMVILYLVFLPPEDRANLLGESSSGSGNGGVGSNVKQILFSQSPGQLQPPGSNIVEHTMPAFMVFTTTNTAELKSVSNIYVKNSAFSDSFEEVEFFFDDRTTENVKLSFSVAKRKGNLMVFLNDKKLFEGEIKSPSPAPIEIPRELLTQRNVLRFEVSEVGAAFWSTNEYEIENLLISADVTNYGASISEQHFSISAHEMVNMEKAVFEFLPDCPPGREGFVNILINNQPIYSSLPDCGVHSSIELSKEFLRQGDNVLTASTQAGAFLLDMPKVVTMLKQSEKRVFYFNVPDSLMQYIGSGQNALVLTLRFADAVSMKAGAIDINDARATFQTQDIIYQVMISPNNIFNGPNSISITPSQPLDVVELRVEVI